MNSISNNRRRKIPGIHRSKFFLSKQRDHRLPLRRSYRKRRPVSSKLRLNERRRLKIENLNKEFQNTELKKLFEPFGKLIRCGINFNKMGKSKGTADIEFSKHEECEKAINKLDNAEIDGVKVRVKYADFGSVKRRINNLSRRRRNAREINRIVGRRIMNRNNKNNSNGSIYRRRRTFKKALGRKRR